MRRGIPVDQVVLLVVTNGFGSQNTGGVGREVYEY